MRGSALRYEGDIVRVPRPTDSLPSPFCAPADKVRESSGCVLVHCLAGVSRSPTVAIAYVMRHLGLSSDDAYR